MMDEKGPKFHYADLDSRDIAKMLKLKWPKPLLDIIAQVIDQSTQGIVVMTLDLPKVEEINNILKENDLPFALELGRDEYSESLHKFYKVIN